MDKRILISEIIPKLNQMGIVYTLGQGTDITIECEFLDASWGMGNKKINYTSSVFFNETEDTVYMWELTKEIGSGLSLGGDGETYFQSGKTLFRKVKSVHYGPDGKVYEYTLDLGAISKVFKETAKMHGWRFKTVLKRDKASYPTWYSFAVNVNQQQAAFTPVQPVNLNPHQDHNFAPPPPAFQQYEQPTVNMQSWNTPPPPPPVSDMASQVNYMPEQRYSNPNVTFYIQGSKNKGGMKEAFFWIVFTMLLLITVLMFSYAKNSIIGWCLAAAIFVLLFLLRKTLTKKGCLIDIIIWAIVAIVLFLIFAFTIGEN